MATIQDLKNQILNVNTLGIANLASKGIIVADDASTYDIMQGIGNIQVGGGGSTGLEHSTAVRYIPAPRIKTAWTVSLPDISHSTTVVYAPCAKLSTSHTVAVEGLTHDSAVRKTIKNNINMENNIVIPTITHETEVMITNG